MTKIKVTKAIGKVLDGYKGEFDAILIDLVKRQCNGTLRDDERVLYNMNPIELSLAIANGYEIELTKIEEWNERIQYIKSEIEYNNEINNYDVVDAYQSEFNAIKELNDDFKLGLTI